MARVRLHLSGTQMACGLHLVNLWGKDELGMESQSTESQSRKLESLPLGVQAGQLDAVSLRLQVILWKPPWWGVGRTTGDSKGVYIAMTLNAKSCQGDNEISPGRALLDAS